jgi:hypothetical protein
MPTAQPLYPHTLNPPPAGESPSVDVNALGDMFRRSSAAVMYINTELGPADRQALYDQQQLVAEFDTARGVDGIRQATDDEFAAAGQSALTHTTGDMELKPAPDVTPYPVESSRHFKVGDIVHVENHGLLQVTLIDGPEYLDLQNLEDPTNAAVGTVAPPGSVVRTQTPA